MTTVMRGELVAGLTELHDRLLQTVVESMQGSVIDAIGRKRSE